MKRLLWIIPMLIAVAAGAVLVNPGWRSLVIGYLRHEPAAHGRPIGYWIEVLRAEDPASVGAATEALSQAGPNARPIPIASLTDPNPLFRERVAETLARMGPDAVP